MDFQSEKSFGKLRHGAFQIDYQILCMLKHVEDVEIFCISCSFLETLTKSYVGTPSLYGWRPTGNPGSAPADLDLRKMLRVNNSARYTLDIYI